MNQIIEAFSKGEYTFGTFIDLFKIFDPVNNNILLEKSKAYGIQFEHMKWFRSYLSKPKWKLLNVVFPKVLYWDNCFFLVFVNDLSTSTRILDPVIFEYYTNIFCHNDNIRTLCLSVSVSVSVSLYETANQELNKINERLLVNTLRLMVEKAKYELLHKFRDQDNVPINCLRSSWMVTLKEKTLSFLVLSLINI